MSLNKLVHETRGKCWHEPDRRGYCTKCQCKSPRMPDYENSMDACMELWEGSQSLIGLHVTDCGHWLTRVDTDGHRYDTHVKYDTPQLAIIASYLLGKGVDLEKETQ